MKTKLKLKLASLLMNFSELDTDKETLHFEGELAEGTEVFIEKDSQFIPAPDGEYFSGETTYLVKEGKIAEIRVPAVEEPIEQPTEIEAEETPEIPSDETKEEEPMEESTKETDALREEIKALSDRVDTLEATVKELLDTLSKDTQRLDDVVEQFSKFSVAKPAEISVDTPKGGLTGDAEYDKQIKHINKMFNR